MSWDQSKLQIGRLALAALLVAGAASAAANVLVVRSAGPSAKTYSPGRSLPDNTRITLKAGDQVTVLDARGTRSFRGPGVFSASAPAQAGVRTVDSSGRRARVGAVRSAGIVPTSPSTIWQVDVSQSGTMCLANLSDVTLWRADSANSMSLAIVAPDRTTRNLRWPAGQATLAWPSDLPITDGAEYQFRPGGVAVPNRITFKSLGSQPADMQAVAEALIRSDCPEQLALLIDSVPAQ